MIRKTPPSGKRSDVCVRSESIDNLDDGQLQCLLDELVGCRHTGDIASKSPLTQELMKQAEESESGEESIQHLKRQRAKKPRERRRRRDSGLVDVSVSNIAGGSLDNIAGSGDTRRGRAARAAGVSTVAGSRRRSGGVVTGAAARGGAGVAGRSREGGSCCNLSRGSFETSTVGRRRRRRRDPHRHHHGSLEDLNAIDESSAGARSSVAELSKQGGSLQNMGASGSDIVSTSTASDTATAGHVIIDMSNMLHSAEQSRAAVLTAPVDRCEAPPAGTQLTRVSVCSADHVSTVRRLPSLEEAAATLQPRSSTLCPQPADAVVSFPLQLTQSPVSGVVSGDSALLSALGSHHTASMAASNTLFLGADGCLRAHDRSSCDRGERFLRKLTPAESAVPSVLLTNGSRHVNVATRSFNSAGRTGDSLDKLATLRNRRAKKKEPELRTDSVDGYRGHDENVDNLLEFIESVDRASSAASGSVKQKCSRRGREQVAAKSRRTTARTDEERRPTAVSGRRCQRVDSSRAQRSSSLETTARSAQNRDCRGAEVTDTSSGRFCGDLAVVTHSPIRQASVDDISTAGDSEFHVVTRRNRRSRACVARAVDGGGDCGAVAMLPVVSASLTGDTASRVSVADQGTSLSRSVTAPLPPCSSSSSSLCSWASIARSSGRVASASAGSHTDYIDGVGPIFNDANSRHTAFSHVTRSTTASLNGETETDDVITSTSSSFSRASSLMIRGRTLAAHSSAELHQVTASTQPGTGTSEPEPTPVDLAATAKQPPKYVPHQKASVNVLSNQRPLASDSTNQRPPASDSTNQRPLANDSTNQRPLANDSTNQRPSASDPTNQRPPASDSTNQRSSANDSTNQRSSANDSTNQRSSANDSTNQRSTSCVSSSNSALSHAPPNNRAYVSESACLRSTASVGRPDNGFQDDCDVPLLVNGTTFPTLNDSASNGQCLKSAVSTSRVSRPIFGGDTTVEEERASESHVAHCRSRAITHSLSAPHSLVRNCSPTRRAGSLTQLNQTSLRVHSQKTGGEFLSKLEAQLDTDSPVFRIHFGFVDEQNDSAATERPSVVRSTCAISEPARDAASCATNINDEHKSRAGVVSAVDVFCLRFRQPLVNVSRFNWREVSAMLSKV